MTADGPVIFQSVSTAEEAYGGIGCGAGLLLFFGIPLLVIVALVGAATTTGAAVLLYGALAVAGAGTLFGLWSLIDGLRIWRTPRALVSATSSGLRVWSVRPPRRSILVPWHQIVAVGLCREKAGVRTAQGRVRQSGVELTLSPSWPASVSHFRAFEVDDPDAIVLSADHGSLKGSALLEQIKATHARHRDR